MKHLTIAAVGLLLATAAFAENHEAAAPSGDAAAGEETFNRQCVACHVVENEDGEILAGRKARTGPNLYGVAMRTLGTVDGFKYGKSMVKAGEEGMTWTEENFVGYVQDPTKWLREALDDRRARGKMSFKVKKEEDAANIFAYLASVGPEPEAEKTN